MKMLKFCTFTEKSAILVITSMNCNKLSMKLIHLQVIINEVI